MILLVSQQMLYGQSHKTIPYCPIAMQQIINTRGQVVNASQSNYSAFKAVTATFTSNLSNVSIYIPPALVLSNPLDVCALPTLSSYAGAPHMICYR